MKFQIDKRSFNVVVSNFQGTAAAERAAAFAAIGLGGRRVVQRVREQMSVAPIGGSEATHTQALAAMDHPYARRHPGIRYRPPVASTLGVPSQLLIHTVSGELVQAVDGVVERQGPTFRVEVSQAVAPHAQYVLAGTVKMHGRNVLIAVAGSPVLRRELMSIVVDVFGRIFRSKASIRFV